MRNFFYFVAAQSTGKVKKTKRRISESKRTEKPKKKLTEKSTREIMEEKFGALAIDKSHSLGDDKVNGQNRKQQQSSEQTSSTNIDQVSLEITDYPSYTLDEEKLVDKPASVSPTPHEVGDVSSKPEPLYSETIDLSAGITVPHAPLEHWSTFINSGNYHPDPPIPFPYILLNPQTNVVAEDPYMHGYYQTVNAAAPTMVDFGIVNTEQTVSPSYTLPDSFKSNHNRNSSYPTGSEVSNDFQEHKSALSVTPTKTVATTLTSVSQAKQNMTSGSTNLYNNNKLYSGEVESTASQHNSYR